MSKELTPLKGELYIRASMVEWDFYLEVYIKSIYDPKWFPVAESVLGVRAKIERDLASRF